MSRYNRSDFEIGYDYARQHYSFLATKSPRYLRELGTAYLRATGPTAELARGMAFYFLELEMKKRHSEITPSINKEDCL